MLTRAQAQVHARIPQAKKKPRDAYAAPQPRFRTPALIAPGPIPDVGQADCRGHNPHTQEPTAGPTAAPTAAPTAKPPPPPPPPPRAKDPYEELFWIFLALSIAGAVGLIVMLVVVCAKEWAKRRWGGFTNLFSKGPSAGALTGPFV